MGQLHERVSKHLVQPGEIWRPEKLLIWLTGQFQDSAVSAVHADGFQFSQFYDVTH